MIGAGIVMRQGPLAGNLVHHAEACTLVCSFVEPAKKDVTAKRGSIYGRRS